MKNFYKNDILIVQSIILLIISYTWIAFFLTLLGIFYTSLIWSIWILLNILFIYKKIIKFPKPSKLLFHTLILSTILSVFIILNSNPTIFTGRDQGSISQAAIQLNKHHTAFFHTNESDIFFEHYGAGKALNFPGFHYTETGALTTQFPLPYITFLAGFIGIFGLIGISIANATLFFAFVTVIGSISRFILPTTRYIYWFLTILITSAPILYFTSFSLSENLASTLIFSLIILFFFYYKEKNNLTLLLLLVTVGILTFTRIEGFWFLFITIYLLFKNKKFIKHIIINHTLATTLFTSLFFSISLATLFTNFSFYKTLLGVFISKLSISPHSISSEDKFSFLINIFLTFNIFIPLIFCAVYVFHISMRKKNKKTILFPLFLILPIFIYYLNPNISQDAPWMLRRYVFALIPITILYTTAFIALISYNKQKYLPNILFIFLIILNLSSTIPLLSHKSHISLRKDIETIAKKFSPNDLILLAQNVSGDGFAMISGPLRTEYNLHAVYFFNEHDYDKINKNKFKNVFIIIPKDDISLYHSLIKNLTPYDTFIVKTSFLPIQKSYPISFIHKNVAVENYIFKLK